MPLRVARLPLERRRPRRSGCGRSGRRRQCWLGAPTAAAPSGRCRWRRRRGRLRPRTAGGPAVGCRSAQLRGVPAAGQRLRLELGGAGDEVPHFVGEHFRIAAAHRLDGFLLRLRNLPSRPPLAAGSDDPPRRQQRNGVRLQMFGGAEPAQVRDQLVLVARRHQRRQQDHVGDLLIDGRDGRIPRLDQDQLRLHQLADDVLEDAALADVGFDCENECHLLVPSSQFPITNSQLPRHSQLPTPKPTPNGWRLIGCLGVGSALVIGSWSLGPCPLPTS